VDKELKLVKVASRQVKKEVYSRHSIRPTIKTTTVHDYELHHPDTDEPVFKLGPKPYGKGYKLQWHDYQKSSWPHLEGSLEHNGGLNYGKGMEVGAKDYSIYRGTELYKNAARGGFKDTLVHSKGEDGNWKFHDPDTHELITHTVTHENGYSQKHIVNRSYLQNHGIDDTAWQNHSATHPYELAKHIYSQKGKKYAAHGLHTANTTMAVFKSGGGTDEELSAAHEKRIQGHLATRLQNRNPKLVRHTPTLFTYHADPMGDHDGEVHGVSHAVGGRLYHHDSGTYVSKHTSQDKF
jgi:hypothetical protein